MSTLLWLFGMRISKALKPHVSVRLQFSETCVHRGTLDLRMKGQLPTCRPRVYRGPSFRKQIEEGTYSLANYITEMLAVLHQFVIVYDK